MKKEPRKALSCDLVEISGWVHGASTDSDFKMQMTSSGPSGAAHLSDDIPLGHTLANSYIDGTQVRVGCFYAVSVVHDDQFSIGSFRTGKGHFSVSGRQNAGASGIGDVDSVMESSSSGHRMDSVSISACKSSAGWPDEGCGSFSLQLDLLLLFFFYSDFFFHFGLLNTQ